MNKMFGMLLLGGLAAAAAALLPKRAKAAEGALGPLEPTPEEEEEAAAQDEADRKAWEDSLGGREPTPSEVQQTYEQAMRPDFVDVGQLRYAYNLLHLYGTAEQAGAVARKIDLIESGQYFPGPVVRRAPEPSAAEPVPPPAPSVVAPEPPPPLAEEEQAPDLDPNGTVALARLLVDRETEGGWKSAYQDQVKTWQSKVGLTADGKFGPKSGLEMAEEVGILPLVRYWSGWDKKAELGKYRDALNALAFELESDPDKRAHAVALRESAKREKAQSWPKPAGAQPAAIPMADFDAMRDAIRSTYEAEG